MADQRLLATEEVVGANHPTKADTVNRLVLVEHNNDGTHLATAIPLHGQCRLAFVNTTTLRLSPFNGNKLLVKHPTNGWEIRQIPSAGIDFAVSGLSAGTDYFAYIKDDGAGGLAGEFSTTGHATDTDTGVEIKSGDATRTLVGMARPTGGPVFEDNTARRLVVSHFNQKPLELTKPFTADRTTTSTSWVEPNTEIRIEFLVLGSRPVLLGAAGRASNSAAGGATSTSIGIDGTTPEDVVNTMVSPSASDWEPVGLFLPRNGLSEGYHYATLLGLVSANTGTWAGGASAPFRTTMKGVVWG